MGVARIASHQLPVNNMGPRACPGIPVNRRFNISPLPILSLHNYFAHRNDIYRPNTSVTPKHQHYKFYHEHESTRTL